MVPLGYLVEGPVTSSASATSTVCRPNSPSSVPLAVVASSVNSRSQSQIVPANNLLITIIIISELHRIWENCSRVSMRMRALPAHVMSTRLRIPVSPSPLISHWIRHCI